MERQADKLMEKSFTRDRFFVSYELKKRFQRRVFHAFFIAVLIIVFVSMIFTLVVYPVFEKSNSMSPSIIQNSVMLVTPIKTSISRGDVFLVDNHNDEIPITHFVLEKIIRFFTFQRVGLDKSLEELSSKKSLSRVVGVPGDTIYMKDFILYVKPKNEKYFYTEFELIKKKYDLDIFNLPKNWDTEIGFKSEFPPVVLGEKQYFVLADNRFSGLDSRYWGVLKKSELVAKALLLYYPFSKVRIF